MSTTLPELQRAPDCLDTLREAKARHEFVRVHRHIPGADDIVGHVVLVGSQWVLIGVISDGSPNGWVAVLVDDIASVDSEPGGRFVRRALEHQQSWPAQGPLVPLVLSEGARALIVSAASYFPLVTLYVEREDPFHCFVGRPHDWTENSLSWQEMDLAATWSPELCEWNPGTITRVDFGGQYETALARVAELRSASVL